uniref:Uncharacterized protein n=1 Tax=Cacopsylla melanoneura TaxID=428564 RepID=A0A8D8VW17_9HEMI
MRVMLIILTVHRLYTHILYTHILHTHVLHTHILHTHILYTHMAYSTLYNKKVKPKSRYDLNSSKFKYFVIRHKLKCDFFGSRSIWIDETIHRCDFSNVSSE